MPPKKALTPHQLSSGLTYVPKEAPFLAKLKNERQEEVKKRARFQDYEDGQDDADYDELDGAQVVTLDDKGKEVYEKSNDDEEEEEEKEKSEVEEEDRPPVDESGRILFRAKKKKRKVEETNSKKEDNDNGPKDNSSDSKPKKKKVKKAQVKLSFDNDDE